MISTRTGAEIILNAQYIKDLSFENPKAPMIYTKQGINPDINVSIDINATKLQDNVFEIELIVTAKAKEKEETIFILEITHAGIFRITNTTEQLLEETIFVDCPYLLFPFTRNIIANVTRDANFQSLLLEAIDFETLYKNRKQVNNN